MSVLGRLRRALAAADEARDPRGPRDDVSAALPSARTAGDRTGRELLGRLRREIAVIERRHRLEPAPSADPRFRSAALPSAGSAEPRPMLRREHSALPAGARLGRLGLAPCEPELMADLSRLLPLIGGVAPGGSAPLRPRDLLFVDTETTGLSRGSGTIAFLIGIGSWREDGGVEVEQLLLGEPLGEARALELLEQRLARARVLVSFNGRSFDLPILRNRFVLCGRSPSAFDLPHVDLLPPVRRLFASRLSDCRLNTVERELCGLVREDDLPGSEAPEVFADYLRGHAQHRMEALLEHNRADVAVLPPLLALLVRRLADPLGWAEDAEELVACARLHLRTSPGLATRSLRRALELPAAPRTRRMATELLARQLRRQGDRPGAAVLWEQMCGEFPRYAMGWIELAKYHEHVSGDLERALALACSVPQPDDPAVAHRVARLRRRLRRADAKRERADGRGEPSTRRAGPTG